MSTHTTQAPKDLIGFLDYYLVQQSPLQLPDQAKEWIVRFGPWITVVLLVLMLPALLFALGVGAVISPMAGVTYTTGYTIVAVATIAEMALMVAALPGLFARKIGGWRLVFYSVLIGLVGSLLSGAIITGLISTTIGLFILFQIRALHHD